MDLILNVTSAPIPKKAAASKVTNKNIINNKTSKKLQKTANSDSGFEFKWDSSKSTKSVFVNKKAQKGNKTLFTPKKQDTFIDLVSEEEHPSFNQLKKQSAKKQAKNQDTSIDEEHANFNQLKKQSAKKQARKQNTSNNLEERPNFNQQNKTKVFPLFNKYSEAATGHAYENLKGKSNVEQVFSTSSTFKDLQIHPHVTTNLERIGLTTLTAVQEKAIPEVLQGKNVFIRSQTGSGKTLAYAIPIVETLRSIEPHINRKDGVLAIVVVPTRELALQTYEVFLKLVEPFRWIVPGRLCGGENRNSEKARLRKGITILIGTPGRLLDHTLHTTNLKLDKVRCLVLDEADRLLDMGFQKDINKLVQQIDEANNNEYNPLTVLKTKGQRTTDINNTKERQTILLSATLTSNVKDLATFTMKDYIYIDPLNSDPNIDINLLDEQDINREVVVPESVTQQFVITDVRTRLVVLAAFIVSKAKENCKMFVFMASKQMVEYHELLFKKCLLTRPKKENGNNVMISLDEDDFDSDCEVETVLDIEFFKLHGSMDQKERTDIFKSFRNVKKGVLFCTDVAARGVDIPHADYVVQYTAALQDNDYIHRVGRTGRAGKKGLALLFLTEPELDYIKHLKDLKLFLKREQQDNILKHLIPFMDHMNLNSVQTAAELLQKRFEKAVIADKSLHRAACFAYSTWSRYYSNFPNALRNFFNIKKAHLGHYVTSFALRDAPQQIGRIIRSIVGKTKDIRLNRKLDNHEREEEPRTKKPTKKRRNHSQFDSELAPKKKKENENIF